MLNFFSIKVFQNFVKNIFCSKIQKICVKKLYKKYVLEIFSTKNVNVKNYRRSKNGADVYERKSGHKLQLYILGKVVFNTKFF